MRRTLVIGLLVLASLMGTSTVGLAEGDVPGLMDPATEQPGLAIGDSAPNSALLDAEGKEVHLSALYAEGPVVITFYRGGWCPFCTKALKDWEQAMPALAEAGGTFVAVSPETPEHASNTGAKHAPSVRVLSDTDGAAAKAFRVAFEMEPDLQKTYKGYGVDLSNRNASGRWELPAPATFVIDREGVVRWAFADWDYKKRADIQAVIAAVRDAAR